MMQSPDTNATNFPGTPKPAVQETSENLAKNPAFPHWKSRHQKRNTRPRYISFASKLPSRCQN
eukprot:1916619-Ditylum_brightwellii.AAC.1